ncbi:MAG: hypothetical protein ABDH20_05025 [Thermus sp.]
MPGRCAPGSSASSTPTARPSPWRPGGGTSWTSPGPGGGGEPAGPAAKLEAEHLEGGVHRRGFPRAPHPLGGDHGPSRALAGGRAFPLGP